MTENDIIQALEDNFESITVSQQRDRRIWLESPRKGFLNVLTYLRDELGFVSLCTVTGLDSGEQFQLIYHLAQDYSGIMVNARVSVSRKNPVFDTATDIFPGGMLYELEARNLLGLKINGIPEDIKYPLPDNWPKGQYPLRKDWVVPATQSDPAESDDDAVADDEAADDAGVATATDAAAATSTVTMTATDTASSAAAARAAITNAAADAATEQE